MAPLAVTHIYVPCGNAGLSCAICGLPQDHTDHRPSPAALDRLAAMLAEGRFVGKPYGDVLDTETGRTVAKHVSDEFATALVHAEADAARRNELVRLRELIARAAALAKDLNSVIFDDGGMGYGI